MEMDLQDIRDFVRDSLETDDEELPNAVLDVYISEGFERAIDVSRTWDFYAVEYDFDTDPDVQAYNVFGPVADLVVGVSLPLASVTDLRSDTWSVSPIDHRAARAMFRRTSPTSGRPYGWSEFGQSIYLWPTPDTTYELMIAGYRKPDYDWLSAGAGALPDCPSDFHNPIAFHALSRGWAQLSDPEMAVYYDQMFLTDVQRLKGRYNGLRGTGPFVQNDPRAGRHATGIGRLIYPWE